MHQCVYATAELRTAGTKGQYVIYCTAATRCVCSPAANANRGKFNLLFMQMCAAVTAMSTAASVWHHPIPTKS